MPAGYYKGTNIPIAKGKHQPNQGFQKGHKFYADPQNMSKGKKDAWKNGKFDDRKMPDRHGKNNPMFGRKNPKLVEYNTQRRLKPKREKPLEVRITREIRKLGKYVDWKNGVLKRDIESYPEIPKNTQVHHLKPLLQIVKENNIKTIEETKNCEEIWDINNGVSIPKGEHFILTLMERHKKTSIGFIEFLKYFIEKREKEAVDLDVI